MALDTAIIDQHEFLYKLCGAGDETKWAAIAAALNAGQDALTMGGVELERNTIINSSNTTITATSMTAITGWTLPTLTYIGRPILIEVEVPSIVHPTAGATVALEIRNGSGVKLATSSRYQPVAGGNMGFKVQSILPVAGQYDLTVGDTIAGIQVYGLVSAGTATVHSYWDNALLGTTPVIIRAVQQ